jgi:hypothetical protein
MRVPGTGRYPLASCIGLGRAPWQSEGRRRRLEQATGTRLTDPTPRGASTPRSASDATLYVPAGGRGQPSSARTSMTSLYRPDLDHVVVTGADEVAGDALC